MSDLTIGDVITHENWMDDEREVILGEVPGFWLTTEVEYFNPAALDDADEVEIRSRSKTNPKYKLYQEPLKVGDVVSVFGDGVGWQYEILGIRDQDVWLGLHRSPLEGYTYFTAGATLDYVARVAR